MRPLPEDVFVYKTTAWFTESSVPVGLLRTYHLKPGSWGRIVVTQGELDYTIEREPVEKVRLSPERIGVVEPEVPHHVTPLGPVRFRVEFLKQR